MELYIGLENARLFGSTGLSQSDLSISSGNVNPNYRYGNQVEYDDPEHFAPASASASTMYNGCIVSYEAEAQQQSRVARGNSSNAKWIEFDKSPDADRTLDKGSYVRDNGDSVSMCKYRYNRGVRDDIVTPQV